ncbi:MAG: hypothetical protein AVDCRST_MAG41-169 [uncultured Corynebacteriales bacterium]|uniref:Uncharacterized protein n=1 Tax=uncultured Mycobacteriales bacterium TaxID=581187 RepID=A0A6J4H6K1_9ACTN|nr:MAG: hypothetical protein AVDCRST_MAG41-169 [uncultured Corynebacteriales bacterium]
MRSGEDGRQELPAPREAPAEERPEPRPDGERQLWVHGPQTPAERAAARRRLDRLAEETR